MTRLKLSGLFCVSLATGLGGCGSSQVGSAEAGMTVLTNVFSLNSLYDILKATPADAHTQQDIETGPLYDYFGSLQQVCNDEPFVVNGQTIAGVATRLKAVGPHTQQVSSHYASLGAMYKGLGIKTPVSWSHDDVTLLAQSLVQTAKSLGLTHAATGALGKQTPGAAWMNLQAIGLLTSVEYAATSGKASLALSSDSGYDSDGYGDDEWPPAPVDNPRGQAPKGSIPRSVFANPPPPPPVAPPPALPKLKLKLGKRAVVNPGSS